VIVAWLMVSKVPTISSKAIRVPREWQLVVLLAGAVVVGLMVTRFWLLLVILDLAYAAVTVVAVVRHFRARRAG
jgi:CDP-diacylglycerol--serine O-phosphatidyltransferase